MILVTGAAGFIGYHVSRRLAEAGREVLGIDNLNDYYDPALKRARLAQLSSLPSFRFELVDVADGAALSALGARTTPASIIHLAAQAGVRYSIENPGAYVQSNLVGFGNILELARAHRVAHLVYASSSSVYGANTRVPFSVHDNVDHPLSLYAATKKSNELTAHAYAHLFRIPVSGLRFFTVYGPWGRPDMAVYLFTKAILEGKPIDVFNHGKMQRDFTYVDDIVEGIVRVHDRPAEPNPAWSGDKPDPGSSRAPYRVYNIGNSSPVELTELIETIERAVGKSAVKNYRDMQPGDVPMTAADIEALETAVGFRPATPLADGVKQFVSWYRGYYGVLARTAARLA
jgi:UDP-glucuronate 4-epimerase